jgi:hypothetical protein
MQYKCCLYFKYPTWAYHLALPHLVVMALRSATRVLRKAKRGSWPVG